MADIEFPKGIIFKLPQGNAPDYVKGKLSIKREEAIEWLQSKQGEWINLELLESKEGKAYCKVNEWKPKPRQEVTANTEIVNSSSEGDEDLPF